MKILCVLLIVIELHLQTGFSFFKSLPGNLLCLKKRLKSGRQPAAFQQDKDGSFSDKTDVNEVLNKIFETLRPMAGKGAIESGTAEEESSLNIDVVSQKFDKILADIKSSSSLTEMEKRMLYAETSLTLSDTKEGKDENTKLYAAVPQTRRLQSTPEAGYKTSIYTQAVSPVVLVCGPGIVGQKLLELGKSLGKSAAFRFIDADQISILQERELVFALKDARAVIIAADSKDMSGGSRPFVVDEKSIKRLLNTVMSERNKSLQAYNVKIVAMTQATKQPKSFMSLIGGESTELDSEIILQCQKRQLGYAIVKVGAILPDEASAPPEGKVKSRSVRATALKVTKEEEQVASFLPPMPVVFTRSRVEISEYTRASVAVEALLRASTHPQTNSTISVLSADNLDRMPTDAEWDDEFLRIEGPELERIPLRFASEMQIVIKIGRIAKQLTEPNSGLITPIEVERFANGVRILFRPKMTNYVSSKEEKLTSLETEKNRKPAGSVGVGGYVSPEMEAKRDQIVGAREKEKGPPSKVPALPLEGGIEIIIDEQPYRRVRIRRCNMGPQTIVKEESESIILKAIIRGIQALEKDYSKMLVASK